MSLISVSADHAHFCPRCLGHERCASADCLLRADLSDLEHFGDPRRCSHCKRAGRTFTAAEVAAAAGVGSAEVSAATKRGDIDLGSLASVSRWVEGRRSELGSYAGGCYASALRELRLAGCVAQDLGFGIFMWAPVKGGGFAYAGELAGPLGQLAAAAGPRSPGRLALPPFSGILADLARRCDSGPGYDSESAELRRRLSLVIGHEDPVLCRLQVRAARRGK